MAIVVAASAAFVAAFVVLGAVVAGAAVPLRLPVAAQPRPPRAQHGSASASAVGLYLLFETLLDVGLPAGVLPLP